MDMKRGYYEYMLTNKWNQHKGTFCAVTRGDKMRNGYIRRQLRVTNIVEEIADNHTVWK
jgi:hypothetical protein